MLSKAIADALEKVDPDHKEIYQENASAYSEKLKDLDAKYQEVVEGASQKTLLFGDRFPFRYLVDDYGLCCICRMKIIRNRKQKLSFRERSRHIKNQMMRLCIAGSQMRICR